MGRRIRYGHGTGRNRVRNCFPRRRPFLPIPPSTTSARPHPLLRTGGVAMLAKLNAFALVGIDAVPVEVEVDAVHAAIPKTVLVGLPELAVRESVHRIERALANLGYA